RSCIGCLIYLRFLPLFPLFLTSLSGLLIFLLLQSFGTILFSLLWLCLALLSFCIFRSISLLIPLDEFLVSLRPLLSIPIYFSTITKFIFPVDL
ncbi:unnamed protein product, partial [Brassica oleracea]